MGTGINAALNISHKQMDLQLKKTSELKTVANTLDDKYYQKKMLFFMTLLTTFFNLIIYLEGTLYWLTCNYRIFLHPAS